MSLFLTDPPRLSPLTNGSRAAWAQLRPDRIAGRRGQAGRLGFSERSRSEVDALGRCRPLQGGREPPEGQAQDEGAQAAGPAPVSFNTSLPVVPASRGPFSEKAPSSFNTREGALCLRPALRLYQGRGGPQGAPEGSVPWLRTSRQRAEGP